MGAAVRTGVCVFALCLAAAAAACDGTIFDPGLGPGGPPVIPPGAGVEGPAPFTRASRLTHLQY